MLRRLHVPFTTPADVQPHLGDPILHWKEGYSAQELAFCWHKAGVKLPPAIQNTLVTAPEYVNAELVDGHFEREVPLDTNQANSQTDLMLIVGLGDELGVIAIEGKVDESFDKLVCEWNDSPGKQKRLDFLCHQLGLTPRDVGQLRYQLLHRTYSALHEARRYRCRNAVMMVHSFSTRHSWFDDFKNFSFAMKIPVLQRDLLSDMKDCNGIRLRLGWTSDTSIERVTP